MDVKIGSPIPLMTQLFDGNSMKFVRANLFDANNNLLTNVLLTHVLDGFYADRSFMAPETEWVTVQFQVYEDAEGDNIAESYDTSIEVFRILPEAFNPWDELTADHELPGTMGKRLAETMLSAGFIPNGQEIEIEVTPIQIINVEVEDTNE